MIQAFRVAGTVVLVLVALVTGASAVTPSRPALLAQLVFAVCVLWLGYLARSAVQEYRDKGRRTAP